MSYRRYDTPGMVAAAAEDTKFNKDRTSSLPITTSFHRLVPFALEESGRLGRHALALLRELAAKGVSDGHLRPPPSWLPSKEVQSHLVLG